MTYIYLRRRNSSITYIYRVEKTSNSPDSFYWVTKMGITNGFVTNAIDKQYSVPLFKDLQKYSQDKIAQIIEI